MSLVLISSDRFGDHQTPPGHPECSERADVMDVVAQRWRERGGDVVAPRQATLEQLARVHDPGHLRRIAETAGQALALDSDTYTSPESYQTALLAAGAAVDGVERVMGGSHRAALVLVRPPGHHAERGRAMGFCFYNNVAVAAAHARTLGARRVAIVDYDVHHGNGTQHIFEADPSVLYISVHQSPYYPGSGSVTDVGLDGGRGFTVNIPLEAGAVDADYQVIFADVVIPVVQQFEPDLILVSAGFDAHERDPLGGMRLTTAAFAAMTMALRASAEMCCLGRMVVVTEGGYDLKALTESLEGIVETLRGPVGPAVWPSGQTASARGRDAVSAAQHALAPYWTLPRPSR
jgi:acetoin utilization deacetylase AcuC-like enzyme